MRTTFHYPESPYGRTYADVITKISRMDSLPNYLNYGAPLARKDLRYQNVFGFSWLDACLWRFSCVVCSWLGFISQFQIIKKKTMPIYRRIYLSSNWLIEIYHETNSNILWPSIYLSKVVGVDTQGRALNSHKTYESSSFSFSVVGYKVKNKLYTLRMANWLLNGYARIPEDITAQRDII